MGTFCPNENCQSINGKDMENKALRKWYENQFNKIIGFSIENISHPRKKQFLKI